MNWALELWNNAVLRNSVLAWGITQVIKLLLYWAVNREFRLERLFGDGGMPSGHSAAVASAATTSAVVFGFSSFQFAVTALLAAIVMHDAMGVRLQAGKQAKALNWVLEQFKTEPGQLFTEEKLKEFIGHTPTQVFFGGLLGIVIALIAMV